MPFCGSRPPSPPQPPGTRWGGGPTGAGSSIPSPPPASPPPPPPVPPARPAGSSSQVYRGVLGGRSATAAAVTATAGRVLRSGTAIANALYHSDGGTATENNENVWTSASGAIVSGPTSYLRGSADRNAAGVA